MKHLFVRSLFVFLFAVTACSTQGTAPNATVQGPPTYVPAALLHVSVPRAPSFAVPRPPDAAMRAGHGDLTASRQRAILADASPTPAPSATPLPFFTGQAALGNNVYYLSFANGNYFGYYGYLSDPRYIYHFDAGYEYTYDAADGESGIYFYDFASEHFWYTSPTFPFPYLYDFSLNSVLYYYPDSSNPGHYNTNGTRYFYNFNTGRIITM